MRSMTVRATRTVTAGQRERQQITPMMAYVGERHQSR